MNAPPLTPSYDSLLDFIMARATPEDVLAFDLPQSEKDRAIELLDKQDDDALTPEEAAELQQMLVVERIFMALKARALTAKG
jgi:uncharacterized protein YciU (UPF0263 family)